MEANYESLKQQYAEKGGDYYNADRREILPFIPTETKTILDVGCSTGSFGELVKKERDCLFWGIEPDEKSAAVAATKLDKVINNTFSDKLPELQDRDFDVICFNDVLEHLTNPEDTLKHCLNKLSKNGMVVASIPNILFFPVLSQILVSQDWRYQDFGILDKTHLRFFTKKSIVRMFENCGYEIVTIEGVNPSSGRKYNLLNLLLFNHLKDWKYLQFIVQAKPKTAKRD